MVNIEEGVGSVCHRYMCILWYMKLMWCSGVAYIYGQLEEGVGSVCHRYMCILWYMKLMWCSGVCIDLWLIGSVGGVSLPMGIFAFCYMWNLCGVVVLHRSVVDWRRGWGQSAMAICAFCYIWNLCSVVVLHRSMVD